MGKLNLVLPPIQLSLVNQPFIVNRLEHIELYLNGFKSYVCFKVINILHDKDLYPSLQEISWEFDNDIIILKQ